MHSDTEAHGLSLEEQVVRMQALLEACREVHSSIVVQQVLERTARILIRELEMDGAVFLAPRTEAVQNPAMMYAAGLPPNPPFEGCTQFPLLSKDASVLATLVVRSGERCELSIYEQDFIQSLVVQAAVALENAMYHERDLEWARVQQDLQAARNIQRSLLPDAMPRVEGHSLAGRSVTCYEVGGDYLDALSMPDGSQILVVADVAGKGLASAILATSFRAAFRSLVTEPMPLPAVVARMGQLHWAEGEEARRRYVTAIIVRLDPVRQELEVVNAGHNPGLLRMPDGSVQALHASGTPLGLLPFGSYTGQRVAFPPGSRLLLYTDGLTEVFCGEEEFGCERLTELFRSLQTEDASVIMDSLWRDLRGFATDGPQTDDMTALAVCHQNLPFEEKSNA